MNHICIGVTDNCKNPESYGTICVKCNQCGRFDKPKQTNADRIRSLNDAELAEFLLYKFPFNYHEPVENVLDWLKQEAGGTP